MRNLTPGTELVAINTELRPKLEAAISTLPLKRPQTCCESALQHVCTEGDWHCVSNWSRN